MNKKILNFLLIILLFVGILFLLTACGYEEVTAPNTKLVSSEQKIIEEYELAIDNKDADKLNDLIVYDEDIYDELEVNRLSISDIKNKLTEIDSYKLIMSSRIDTKSDLEEASGMEIDNEAWSEIKDILDDGNKFYYLDIKKNDEEDQDFIILDKKNNIVYPGTTILPNAENEVLNRYRADDSTDYYESEAKSNLSLVLISMSNEYFIDYNENDLDSDEKTIEDYFTYEELDDELEDSGYTICDENGKKMNFSDMNKTVVGETIYLYRTNDEDKIVYKADIVKSGDFGVNAENFETVE